MMLLGGDKKKYINAILGPREEDKKPEEDESPLHAIADELIGYIHSHDVEGVVTCLKSAFAHMESEPHEEATDQED